MFGSRLQVIDSDLYAILRNQSEQTNRKLAVLVCTFALTYVKHQHPVVDRGIDLLHIKKFDDVGYLRTLKELVEQLDLVQWRFQDEVERGLRERADYDIAFRNARAVNSLYAAFAVEPLEAASESIYEAVSATDEQEVIRSLVLDSLN